MGAWSGQGRGGFTILSVAFFSCAALAVTLGMFALGGDRLGLWDPLKPAPFPKASLSPKKHLRAGGTTRHGIPVSHSRRVRTPPQSAVGPPLSPGAAFLLAAAAAALAALTSVGGRRGLSRGLRRGFDALAPREFHVTWATRSMSSSVTGSHPRQPRAVVASPVARKDVQISRPFEAVKADLRHSRALDASARSTATGGKGAALRSMLALAPDLRKLLDIVNRTGPVARAAFRATAFRIVTRGRPAAWAALHSTAFRLRQAMWSYRRHQTQIAPYVISAVVSVLLGWMVVALTNQ
jgi:hypothetical protein